MAGIVTGHCVKLIFKPIKRHWDIHYILWQMFLRGDNIDDYPGYERDEEEY